MMVKERKKHSHSILGKKAQVMTVDAIISYLLFGLFLLYMTNYIINISKPFSSYVDYETRYKNAESFGINFLTTDLSRNYLNNICNFSYNSIISVQADYEVKGLVLPHYDESMNTSKKGVHFKREGDTLNILFNTNTTSTLLLNLITLEKVNFFNSSTENVDDFNKTRSLNTVSVTISSNTLQPDDVDEFGLTVSDDTIVYVNYAGSLSQVYAGTTPLSYSCGDKRLLSDKSYYSSYAVLEELKMITSYGVQVYWE